MVRSVPPSIILNRYANLTKVAATALPCHPVVGTRSGRAMVQACSLSLNQNSRRQIGKRYRFLFVFETSLVFDAMLRAYSRTTLAHRVLVLINVFVRYGDPGTDRQVVTES